MVGNIVDVGWATIKSGSLPITGFKEPRNRFQGIDSASLCNPNGPVRQLISTRFLVFIECSKIPAV